MSIDKTGGPAFPCDAIFGRDDDGRPSEINSEGMTLRDYFAAKALPALIAEPSWGEGANPVFSRLGKDGKDEAEMFAKAAYRLADAMLKARAEQ
jgi:hypothetical protein